MFRALKWLYPGMRVKRWITVIFLGVFLSNLGAAWLILGILAPEAVSANKRYGFALLFFLVGGGALLTGVYRLMKSLGELLGQRGQSDGDKELVDIAFERRYLGLGPRVVALGGGTGMSSLLEGLREYTARITAVVSVADDGGSSGRLRREFDMLPPGDVRKCLVALSDESLLLGDLMQYRFHEAGELAGHSFGNLFLTVLWRLTGDFGEAVRQAGRILSVRGRVIPATLDRVSLVAIYEDGSQVTGQREISQTAKRIRRLDLKPNPPPASGEIVEAIDEADLIVIGPGSLYTSVLPNLLIDGIPEALARSGATKVYVANIASSEGETAGYSLRDHLEAIAEHVHSKLDNGTLPFDVALANSASISPARVREIEAAGGRLVTYDPRDFDGPEGRDILSSGRGGNGYGLRFVQADLTSNESALRHDPRKIARTLMTLLAEEREAS
jgi:uncharacterized cofD-like protein